MVASKGEPLLDSDQKKTSRLGNFLHFLYNHEEGSVLGRSALSWGKIGLFYLILYTCLAGFWASLLAIFFQTVSPTHPTYYGLESQTLNNPGMGVRPLPNFDSSLIQFQQGSPSSYKPYTDHLDAFLEDYKRASVEVAGSSLDVCSINDTATADKACEFDWNHLVTQECAVDYGFSIGTPCILIKMNKIFGFKPIPYDSREELIRDHGLDNVTSRFLTWAPGTVGLICDGETNADRENIGAINYYPRGNGLEGFPVRYFPYMNQEGYRAPVVFAVFERVQKQTLLQVNCKLYAKNIDNSGGNRRHGSLHFELIVD